MKTPLTRLLRLRALLEESSRMDLERSTAVALAIEQARERERGNARVSRARAAEAIFQASTQASTQASAQSSAAAAADWLDGLARLREAEWRSAAMSAGHEQTIIPLVRAAERRVSEDRKGFMERRKERRQVERVLESAAERARIERDRHEQRELDDWFGMKRARQSQER